MDWNVNTRRFLPPPDSSLSFLSNYTHIPYSGMEVKQQVLSETLPEMEKMNFGGSNYQEMKKKRLTSEQVELLESSFQKEIKLDPHRKMKLSKELGLQPRQIAVWFQNRRARWKTKQLEHLYDSLKHEFDVVSKEKYKLEQEVMKLKGMLREQVCRTQQVSAELSGEETVESTSEGLHCSNRTQGKIHDSNHEAEEGNCCFTLEDYNSTATTTTTTVPIFPYWPAVVPYYPYNKLIN